VLSDRGLELVHDDVATLDALHAVRMSSRGGRLTPPLGQRRDVLNEEQRQGAALPEGRGLPAQLLSRGGAPRAVDRPAQIHAARAHRRRVGREIVALDHHVAQPAAPLEKLEQPAMHIVCAVLLPVAHGEQLEIVILAEGDGVVRALAWMLAARVDVEAEAPVGLHAPAELRDADHDVVDARKNGRYSAWIFARCTMSFMRARPSPVHFVTVDGLEPIGSRPWAISFSRTSGALTAFTSSAFSRSTIGLGVPSGTTKEAQVRHSKPGTPASAKVGTSGSSGERAALGTPSARKRPSLMKGWTIDTAPKCASRGWTSRRSRPASPPGR